MNSKYFSRSEFACQCKCGFATVDTELLEVLEDVREYYNSPIIITSGCRCAVHNSNIGGSSRSKHTEGIAADFVVKEIHEDLVYNYLDEKYPDKYGIGRYEGRTHIDVRSFKARWDER